MPHPVRHRRARLLAALAVAALAGAPGDAEAQNRALGRNAFASSVWSALRTPDRAVDGNTQGRYGVAPYVFHSDNGPLEWWFVDLGQAYDVSQIRVFNRTDCCEARLNGATIGVWASIPFTAATTVGTIPTAEWSAVFSGVAETASLTQQIDFAPGGASGRYVGIWDTNQYIQLAEVEVYGAPAGISAVPEPGTVALVAGGLVLLAGGARRRRAA